MDTPPNPPLKDLLVLTADSNAEHGLHALLRRDEAIGIRPISFDIHVHPQRDSGVVKNPIEILNRQIHQFRYALVVFDYHGCGRETHKPKEIVNELETRLSDAGWENRCRVVMIQPELEAWVWSDSNEVDRALGWSGRTPDLRTWLQNEGFIRSGQSKPDDPKGALESALRVVKLPRSSSLYGKLGRAVSIRRCTDPALGLLITTLREWFPKS